MVALGKRGLLCLAITFGISCGSSNASQPADDGEETFRNICAKCHGQTGSGGLPLIPGGPAPRDFTDGAWQATKTDAELEHAIREGKNPMPAFKTLLTADQIRAVIKKVRRLRKDR